jgi:hypothetical protein
MNDRKKAAQDFLAGIRLAQSEHERWQEKLRDPRLRDAAELREQAWQLAISRTGDQTRAVTLIEEAAALDPEYLPQVEGIRNYLDRRERSGKVSLPKAINITLSPLLLSRGFEIRSPFAQHRTWGQGRSFVRTRDGRDQRVSVNRAKAGKQLGLLVAWEIAPGQYSYRDHRDFGCAHDDLEYLNQQELEHVVAHLTQLLDTEVLPWLDSQ